VLVISHVYSLSRTPQHFAFLFNELMSQGVRVVSATDSGFDTETAYGVFLVRMLSAVAEIEHEGVLEDRRVHRRQKRQCAHASPLAG
jgi:DNA invertase Pin-like site-specific DNA recombinase